MYMNVYEIGEATRLFDTDETPNLDRAARALYHLMRWTNSHSDGWVYWVKPQRAATRLMDLLGAHTYAARFGYYQGTATPLRDATPAELTAALRPVKSFLTRQGEDWRTVIGG